jgi:phosphoadenosine phosphosulfate reductase
VLAAATAPRQPSPVPPAPTCLAEDLAGLDAAAIVTLLARRFRGRIAAISSFGADAAVLLHLVAQADPDMPVLFLDTGQHFPETPAHGEALLRRLGLRDLRRIRPDAAALAARDPLGGLWALDPESCCALRKVAPLQAALAPFDLWLTGRRRHQAATRAGLPVVETMAPDGSRLRVNPLAAWSAQAVEAYLRAHDLPRHPLVAQGYASIGCAPCTSPVRPGEDPRAGRWRGLARTECGIHRRPAPAAPG